MGNAFACLIDRFVRCRPNGRVFLYYHASTGSSLNDNVGVSCMKTFEVRFRYQDRTQGTVESTVKVDASSLPGAVAKAAREFVKGLDRKQRFDMNKNGLEITTRSVDKTTDTQAEPPPQAAGG